MRRKEEEAELLLLQEEELQFFMQPSHPHLSCTCGEAGVNKCAHVKAAFAFKVTSVCSCFTLFYAF